MATIRNTLWCLGAALFVGLFLVTPSKTDALPEQASDSKQSSGNDEIMESRRKYCNYLERRRYFVETANDVQLALDQVLINVSAGALLLSMYVLQFTSVPADNLNLLTSSWIWLLTSLVLSIFGMALTRLHFDGKRDSLDTAERKRQALEEPKKNWWLVFWGGLTRWYAWLYADITLGLCNLVVLGLLIAGIYQMSDFTIRNTIAKNDRERLKAAQKLTPKAAQQGTIDVAAGKDNREGETGGLKDKGGQRQ